MLEFGGISGCSIPVVRLLWEQIDWVRFPAARPFDSFCKQNSLMVFDHYKTQTIKFKYPRVECPEPVACSTGLKATLNAVERVEGHWLVYLLECKDNTLYCGST